MQIPEGFDLGLFVNDFATVGAAFVSVSVLITAGVILLKLLKRA